MKIGIACVYYVPDTSFWVLEQQLAHIEATRSTAEIKIYGADVRLSERVRDYLTAKEYVSLHQFKVHTNSQNHEHGESLTRLVALAFEDGCDMVLTLDVDSWPINKDWVDIAVQKLAQTDGILAVQRSENDDHYLPHPCGTFITNAFWQANPFDFYPNDKTLASPPFQDFLHQSRQREDTGIGLAEVLHRHQLNWQKLERSNVRDLHYLMAGLYGDIIFHLGASSRAPEFYRDVYDGFLAKLTLKCERKPLIWRLRAWFKAYKIRQARKKLKQITALLQAGTLIDYLRGK